MHVAPFFTDWRFVSAEDIPLLAVVDERDHKEDYERIKVEMLGPTLVKIENIPESLGIYGEIHDDAWFEPGYVKIGPIRSITGAYLDESHVLYRIETDEMVYYVNPHYYREPIEEIV